jgi:exopolysaccharide production protein ExoZ
MREAGNQRFGSLDIGRFLAALAVVLFHCSEFLQHRPFGGVFRVGYVGINFFFVLSGFVITNAHFRDIGCPDRVAAYARKRFLRIFPPYWAASLLAILCIAKFPYHQPVTLINVVTNALLIPKTTRDYPFVVPAWSLSYELMFYLFFAVLIALPKKFAIAALLLWPAMVLLLGPAVTGVFPLSFLFNPLVLQFFLGILAALIYTRIGVNTAVLLLAVGGLLFALVVVGEALPAIFPVPPQPWWR